MLFWERSAGIVVPQVSLSFSKAQQNKGWVSPACSGVWVMLFICLWDPSWLFCSISEENCCCAVVVHGTSQLGWEHFRIKHPASRATILLPLLFLRWWFEPSFLEEILIFIAVSISFLLSKSSELYRSEVVFWGLDMKYLLQMWYMGILQHLFEEWSLCVPSFSAIGGEFPKWQFEWLADYRGESVSSGPVVHWGRWLWLMFV